MTTMACGGEPIVVVAPGQDNGFQSGDECSDSQPCAAGMLCAQGVCVNNGPGFGTPDTSTGGGSLCDNVPNAPGCVDVSTAPDIVSQTDTEQSDTLSSLDTTITVNDLGPVTPPGEDECGLPGTTDNCMDDGDDWRSCRINEETKSTICIGLTTTGVIGTLGTFCGSHENCDLLYGCHFGMCTLYCNLAFGTTINTGVPCPGNLPTCKNVGHPLYGACAAQ